MIGIQNLLPFRAWGKIGSFSPTLELKKNFFTPTKQTFFKIGIRNLPPFRARGKGGFILLYKKHSPLKHSFYIK